jgi:hypothetical protein
VLGGVERFGRVREGIVQHRKIVEVPVTAVKVNLTDGNGSYVEAFEQEQGEVDAIGWLLSVGEMAEVPVVVAAEGVLDVRGIPTDGEGIRRGC